jgi:two-component system, chemotaxis family, protein-glutamate methylesterase/glutaminase
MSRIRVLVVEDSVTVRKRFVGVLSADPAIEVVGEAGDGKRAIELCQALRPDVISLDMILPVLSGLAVTEYIMAYWPTPILVVSSSVHRMELFKTYDALAAGALDVFDKQGGEELQGSWERAFVERVKLVSRIKVIRHVRPRSNGAAAAALRPTAAPHHTDGYRLVAIGSSTGGPAACAEILGDLPGNFSLPVLLVIHIGSAFAGALAEWLDTRSPLRVRCATDGQLLPPVGQPVVIMAPPDRHLILSGGRLYVTREDERHSCRPSVDVLFESIAREMAGQSIACLLTGMGRDGAQGLLRIRQGGGRTLVQDRATSVVFGMPQEAIRIEAAERVLPINEIACELVALAGNARRTT